MSEKPKHFKQVITARKDLGMRKGKLAAQVAHAALTAAKRADETEREMWRLTGQTKIVVGIEGSESLLELYKEANGDGLPASLIRDEGRTELEPETRTAVAIGPAEASRVDQYTGDLDLL
jgi:PTH2 family peptidyl-tRNA hydrolase